MDVPDKHEVVVLVNLEQRILLPGVLTVSNTAPKGLREADAGGLSQVLRCPGGVKGTDKLFLVLRKDVSLGKFLHQFPDAPPVGEQIFPRICVQGPDGVLRVVHKRDPLITGVNLACSLVQVPGFFRLSILRQVGNANEHAVSVLGLGHAPNLNLIVVIVDGKEHPAVPIDLGGIHQVDDFAGEDMIGLGLTESLLGKNACKHACAEGGLFECRVVKQHLETVIGEFSQCQRDTVEFSG